MKIETNNSHVHIGEDVFTEMVYLLDSLNPSQIFILVDENTLEYCLAELISSVSPLAQAEIIEIN